MKRLLLPIILLGVAVAIALSTYFFLVFLQRPRSEDIITAKSDIPSGAVIKEGMLEGIQWQGKEFPKGFIRIKDKKKYMGRVATVDIVKGTPIIQGSLSHPGAPAGLYAKIPTGMRALTVKVDEVSGVAGFIRPGSSVDVLLASRKIGAKEEQESKIILQNVLVLAAGQRTTQLKGESKPKVENTVTLLLSPEGAEKLALATKMGTLSLSLRAGDDTDIVRTRGSVPRDVWGEVREQAPTLVAKAPEVKEKEKDRIWTVVEIIQGGQREEVSFPYETGSQ